MRLCIVFLALLNSVAYGQSLQQIPRVNGVEVIGFGQVNIQTSTHLLDIIINERGASAVKTAQSVEHKVKLIQQFVDKHSNSVKIGSTDSITLKILYPTLNNTIDDVEFFTRLPNKRPVKINTKVNPKLSQGQHNANHAVIAASLHIVASVTDINVYQSLIDYLMKVGVNDVQTMGLAHTEYQMLYQRALNNALANAKFKAQKMLSHLDVSLAEVIAVQEIDVNESYFTDDTDKLKNYAHNEQHSDERTVNAQVKVIFAIKP